MIEDIKDDDILLMHYNNKEFIAVAIEDLEKTTNFVAVRSYNGPTQDWWYEDICNITKIITKIDNPEYFV